MFSTTSPQLTTFNLQREQSSIFVLHDEVQWESWIWYCCLFSHFRFSCCYLLGACKAGFTQCFTPVNVCVIDAKIHSQAVYEIHAVHSAAGLWTGSWNSIWRKGKPFTRSMFDCESSLLLIFYISIKLKFVISKWWGQTIDGPLMTNSQLFKRFGEISVWARWRDRQV